MQQTNQFQFNLMESGDTFSPAPLNENAQKTETLISALSEQIEKGLSELSSQTQAAVESLTQKDGELQAAINGCGTANVVVGTYVGSGTYGAAAPNTLTFEFVPRLVIVTTTGGYTLFAVYGSANVSAIQGMRMSSGYGSDSSAWQMAAAWTGNSLSWYNTTNDYSQFNVSGTTYYYVAIG